MEDQPLPTDASPTALSPGYIANSNLEEDEEDPKVDPADYPVDGGDNDDNESSDDDNDDDDMTLSPQAEDTEAVKTDKSASTPPTSPHHIILFSETKSRIARMFIQHHTPRSPSVEACITEFAAVTTTAECRVLPSFWPVHYLIAQPAREFAPQWGNVLLKFGNCKKLTTMTRIVRNPAAALGINEPCLISTLAERQAENKRKLNNTSNNNQNQQQPNKRQNTGKAYTTVHREKKHYGGSKLLCSKCNYHHDGPCAPKCHKCNRVGHLARDYMSSTNANAVNNQRVTGASQKAICYECGNQGHYRSDCPERKNQNHEKPNVCY
ncbi:reverse transcriptase domain-containing protein [Tanacetum coccineum]